MHSQSLEWGTVQLSAGSAKGVQVLQQVLGASLFLFSTATTNCQNICKQTQLWQQISLDFHFFSGLGV